MIRFRFACAFFFSFAVCFARAGEFSWQEAHAEVLPQGDLKWSPKAFQMPVGGEFRYIDYEGGDDRNDGTQKARAWKHHPLDPQASGAAKRGIGEFVYVFKRGVMYRGALRGKLLGGETQPVHLTSDPSWGQGRATICGSEAVVDWQRGASRDDIPEAEKVWVATLDFAPRLVWMVVGDEVRRIHLARTPNWTVSDSRDVMSEWYEWEQPQWWTDKNKTKTPKGKKIHLGVDRRHLTGVAKDYVGGMVWSEWGIVMGTPFPSLIETFDEQKKGVGFQGFWYGDSGKIITGNRYFLEDRPNFLDAPGEFWFEKKGAGGTLFLRLPGDRDPNTVQVEAAKRINLLDFDAMNQVCISGLDFAFTNVFWDLTARQFVHEDVQPACIRLYGSGNGVQIRNCTFRQVNKAIRLKAVADSDSLDNVLIADNDIRFTDHGAIEVEDSSRWGKKAPPFARLGDVKVLRNRLMEIGHRAIRSDSSHALCISFAETAEVAGNILHRTYGAGIFCFGGKGDGQTRDVPLSRMLIHHNKVTEPLLAANDWGGIETWQGGPAYVYNNISGDPGGYWNWAANKPGNARLGFAFYLDGAFKNYHFNNIAWGRDNNLKSKYCNRTAFYHAVPTILNCFFNNTAYKFAEGSCWSPAGGRQWYLGNLWSDISREVFLHGKQKEDKDAVYDHYPLETVAYSHNVFHRVPDTFGHLEGSGSGEADFAKFRQSMQKRKLMAASVGEISPTPLLRDPGNGDFRPGDNSSGRGRGVKVFVPWGLARTVGEWQFRRNNATAATLLDEHWYMSPRMVERGKYKDFPRFDLTGVGLRADSYEPGVLENWTAGAVTFNGRDQYLVLKAKVKSQSRVEKKETTTHKPADWVEVTTPKAMVPGKKATITVRLLKAPEKQKLTVHLHWLKKQGWGGFNELAKPPSCPVTGEGVYSFSVVPKAKDGLDAFSMIVALTTTGEWKDVTEKVIFKVPAGEAPPPAADDIPGPHDLDGNFLVETYLKLAPDGGHGSIVSCREKQGYQLMVDAGGRPVFTVQAKQGGGIVKGTADLRDSRWHHLLAECDRDAGVLRLYVDGKLSSETKVELKGGCATSGDLLVARSPEGDFLAGSMDFLRISLSTLAESKTSIDELYAWEFDGPQNRDFTGVIPEGARDAGALQGK